MYRVISVSCDEYEIAQFHEPPGEQSFAPARPRRRGAEYHHSPWAKRADHVRTGAPGFDRPHADVGRSDAPFPFAQRSPDADERDLYEVFFPLLTLQALALPDAPNLSYATSTGSFEATENKPTAHVVKLAGGKIHVSITITVKETK